MNPFTKSLRFKITLLVIAVELLIFSGLGVFYTHRFSQEIDNTIIARLSIPGLLMTRGELSFEAVSDKRTMEGLLRAPYSEGMVIGLDGHVYFSSDPDRLETRLDAIDGRRLPGPETSPPSAEARDLITPVQDSTGTYLTCLSPLRPDGKLMGYLYLKVGTAISEAEKRKITILFAIGSLGTIALTVPILSWLLHLMVIRRLNYLVEIFRRFARGDYAARAQPLGGDEIATLMNGFNGLAKRLEETLAHLSESETLLNATQRLSKVGGWEYDVKSGKSFWTEELYRIHEIPNDPGIDHIKESLACYRPEDRQILNDAFQRACEQGESYDLEFPFTTYTGKPLWVRTTAQPVYEEGKVVRLVGNLMDITERKQAEQALLDNRQRMDNIIANSPGAIFRCANDREWTMEFLSAAITRITGYPADDFLDNRARSYASIIHPDDRRAVEEAVSAGVERKDRYEIDYRLIATDGTLRWVHEQGTGVFAADGRLLCLDGVIFDITDQRKAEEEIRKLNQELEQRVAERTSQLEAANKELESFSYSVSHDLRTPLRAIDGFSHILLEDYAGKLDDEGKRLLGVVRDNTSRMGQLIDDILKFSRAGRMELSLSEIDMAGMARAVFGELRTAAGDGAAQLEIEQLPPAWGDSPMMRQVFVNLLSNAIKFSRNSEMPRIKVGGFVEGDEAIYYVKDNGVGFDMQYVDKLFGVFQRLHTVNEFEGTGIGLAIVKRIITRHGGRVWAEGRLNEGATIYFSIPVKTSIKDIP